MPKHRPLFFGLYEQACVGNGASSASLWRHPADERLQMTGLPYWLNLARIAEEADLDLFFFGDVLGIYDTYQDSAESAVRWGVELPAHDPVIHIPALAAVTEHLAFGATISTTYEHPFAHARRQSTLDHLTGGRLAWNIVTSYLPSAARNFGLPGMIDHDQRYEIAEEFMEVVYGLWEGSWADGSFVGDKESGTFADPTKVRAIDHQGEHFASAGPHVSIPSPQRTPVLIQAGASPRGVAFGAAHAEVIFVGWSSPESVRKGLAEVRRQADEIGRDGSEIRALSGADVIVGRTHEEAQRKLEDYQRWHSLEAQLTAYAGWSGFDLSRYEDDEPLGARTNHTQSAAPGNGAAGRPVTAGDLRRRYARVEGNTHLFIGTPTEVADGLERYAEEVGIDGYLLHQFVSPRALEDFAELVVPELRRRGSFREGPPSGTLRSRIRDDGADRLPAGHPAARHRFQPVSPS
jgi:long-chain alkane monooxygenase